MNVNSKVKEQDRKAKAQEKRLRKLERRRAKKRGHSENLERP
jgi:hypothetical protein